MQQRRASNTLHDNLALSSLQKELPKLAVFASDCSNRDENAEWRMIWMLEGYNLYLVDNIIY